MSSSFSAVRRVRLGFPIWFTLGAAALPSLVLIGILLPTTPAESFKLKLETTWPGQYDTETGARPDIGFPLPTCALSAEPTIAVSNITINAGGVEALQMGADWNFGNFERNGQSDFERQLSLGMYFTNLLPNADNESIESPSLVFDDIPLQTRQVHEMFWTCGSP